MIKVWAPLAVGVAGAVVLVAVLASGSSMPTRQEVEERLATTIADRESAPAVVTATCDEPTDEGRVSCRTRTDDGRRGWASVTLEEGSRSDLTPRQMRDPSYLPEFPGYTATYRGELVLDAAGNYDRTLPAPFGTDARGAGQALTVEVGLALRAAGLSGVVPFTCPPLEVGAGVTCTGRGAVPSATVDRVGGTDLRLRFAVPVT